MIEVPLSAGRVAEVRAVPVGRINRLLAWLGLRGLVDHWQTEITVTVQPENVRSKP